MPNKPPRPTSRGGRRRQGARVSRAVNRAGATKLTNGGTGANSFTPSELVRCNAAGDALESSGLTTAGVAPAAATYVVLSVNGTLTNERVLTEGAGIDIADAGAGSTLTITVDLSEVFHNDLSSKQGGTAGEFYHLTSVEYTGTGTGAFVRASVPTITTPFIATVNGSSSSGGTLTLTSTTHATKGKVFLGTSTVTVDEANGRLGLGAGATSPTYFFHLLHPTTGTGKPSDFGMVFETTQGTPRRGGFYFGGGNDFVLGAISDHTLNIAQNDVPKVVLENDDTVAICPNSAGTKQHVFNGTVLTINTAANGICNAGQKLEVINTSAGARTTALALTNASGNAGTQTSLDFCPNTNIPLARINANRTAGGGATDLEFSTYTGSALTLWVTMVSDGAVKLSTDAYLKLVERSSNPATPTNGTEGNLYVKGDKLIVQFNNGGTVKYWYLDLTSTSGTWTYTAVAP